MAKKGRDLFEILGARASGGVAAEPAAKPARSAGATKRAAPRKAAARPDAGADGTSLWSRIRAAFAGGNPDGVRLSGLVMVGGIFACLLLGFFLGRMTSSGVPGDLQELRKDGQAPKFLGDDTGDDVPIEPTSADLDAAEEQEVLTDYAFVLMRCDDAELAAETAQWMRTAGFPTTRFLWISKRKTNFVLTYVDDAEGADTLADLQRLDARDFNPDLDRRLGELKAPSTIKSKSRKS